MHFLIFAGNSAQNLLRNSNWELTERDEGDEVFLEDAPMRRRRCQPLPVTAPFMHVEDGPIREDGGT
jgi:hypothetical protein